MASRCHCHAHARKLFDPCHRLRGSQPAHSAAPRAAPGDQAPNLSRMSDDTIALPENFCIIEDRSTVADFAHLQLDAIDESIQARLSLHVTPATLPSRPPHPPQSCPGWGGCGCDAAARRLRNAQPHRAPSGLPHPRACVSMHRGCNAG